MRLLPTVQKTLNDLNKLDNKKLGQIIKKQKLKITKELSINKRKKIGATVNRWYEETG